MNTLKADPAQIEIINTIFSSPMSSKEQEDYRQKYYFDLKNLYSTNYYTTQDGIVTAEVEVYKYRRDDPDELDAAIILASYGVKVTLLKETGKKQGQKHPDVLANNLVFAEIKHVKTNNARNISDEIVSAINKGLDNIPLILFIKDALDVEYDNVLKFLNNKKNDISVENKNILFLKNNQIVVVEKNGMGAYSAFDPKKGQVPS